MKIVRIKHAGELLYAKYEQGLFYPMIGDLFSEHSFDQALPEEADVQILAPVVPVNIIAIGLNYRRHARESKMELPSRPLIFLKASSSVIGPDQAIIIPKEAPDEVDYEVELAVVIGKLAKNVSEADALDYVLGYTIANDVSARDCQLRIDSQWARGKSFDTFCPLGPWLETELDPADLSVKTLLNGQVMQDSSTKDMIFNVQHLISYCSHNMTLLPGTVILTGTPEGVGFARKPAVYLKDGDTVELEIEGIGRLRNRVVS